MVRKDLAEEMGLEGRQSKIVITKVGGTEEELDTKIYKVTVSTDDGKEFKSSKLLEYYTSLMI
jgi:hypothetical protein